MRVRFVGSDWLALTVSCGTPNRLDHHSRHAVVPWAFGPKIIAVRGCTHGERGGDVGIGIKAVAEVQGESDSSACVMSTVHTARAGSLYLLTSLQHGDVADASDVFLTSGAL